MDLNDLKTNLREQYPDKEINLVLNDQCKCRYEFNVIDGLFSTTGYCIYNKVQVEIEGRAPYFQNIPNHRVVIYFNEIKSLVEASSSSYIEKSILKNLNDLPDEEKDSAIQNLSLKCLLSVEDLKKKVNATSSSVNNSSPVSVVIR